MNDAELAAYFDRLWVKVAEPELTDEQVKQILEDRYAEAWIDQHPDQTNG